MKGSQASNQAFRIHICGLQLALGSISIKFEAVTAFTWLPNTKHHGVHSGEVGMWATQRKDDQEQELVR